MRVFSTIASLVKRFFVNKNFEAMENWRREREQEAAESAEKAREAAEGGSVNAQYYLGLCYIHGVGVPEDRAEAEKWWRRAAEQGYTRAQCGLAGLYYSGGEGVVQDYREAAKWLLEAAEQGNTEAQCRIGKMYGEGKGVLQDDVEAHKWFNLASALGIKDATKERDTLNSRMTPRQIAEAQRLAREWKAKHPRLFDY
jgi:TPR repeat protein